MEITEKIDTKFNLVEMSNKNDKAILIWNHFWNLQLNFF